MTKEDKIELDEAIEELVSDICEKGEKDRENAFISDDNDLFCLMDTLRVLNKYVEQATKCKSLNAVKKLSKKLKKWL